MPGDFRRADAIVGLEGRSLGADTDRLVDRLIGNGIVEARDVAGVELLRFNLDPAAEYFGARDRLNRLSPSREAWERCLDELQAMEGYPDLIEGFLTALAVSHRTYRTALRLPPMTFPWEQRRDPIEDARRPNVARDQATCRRSDHDLDETSLEAQ